MGLNEKFKEKYGKKVILSNCKETKCVLRDISSKNHIILSGDDIKTGDEKSVDCIIIELDTNNIILCELTSGKKHLVDARNKFQASGKLIINDLHHFGESVNKIYCLVLGKIILNGKAITKKKN